MEDAKKIKNKKVNLIFKIYINYYGYITSQKVSGSRGESLVV